MKYSQNTEIIVISDHNINAVESNPREREILGAPDLKIDDIEA